MGFFLTEQASIDMTLATGIVLNKARPFSHHPIPRKSPIFRWGPKRVSGA